MQEIKPLMSFKTEEQKQDGKTYQTSCWLTKAARRSLKRLVEKREDAGIKITQSMVIVEAILLLAEQEGVNSPQ